MTITIGWWGVPLILSLLLIVFDLRGHWKRRSSTVEIETSSYTALQMGLSVALTWGLYGITRAIFG